MQYLLAMHVCGGSWAAMYVAQHTSLLFMLLAVVAVYATVKDQLPAGSRAGPICAAVAAASVPWLAMLGAVAYVESALLLYTTLAIAWMMRAIRGGLPYRDLIVGGVLAGLACGVKYTAVPTILLLVPVVAIVVILLNRESQISDLKSPIENRKSKIENRTLLRLAVFIACGAIVFSPWLIRNAIWTGNPVFPMAMRLLGRAHFDEVQVQRFERAHSVPPALAPLRARLGAAWKGIAAHWQYGFVLLPAGLAAMIYLIRSWEMQFLLLLFGLELLFFLFFTHLQPRFAILLVPIAAIALGLASAHLPRVGAIVAILGIVTGGVALHGAFAPQAEYGRLGLFCLDDYTAINPAVEKCPAAEFALIGNSQAFSVPVPMSRLRYRTIFDIRFAPGQSPLDAWLGEDLATLKKKFAVNIHPGELTRLAEHYYAVPTLAPDWRKEVRRVYGDVRPVWPEQPTGNPEMPIVFPPAP